MIALLSFMLAVLASPFRSKSRRWGPHADSGNHPCSVGGRILETSANCRTRFGDIVAHAILGGLHHRHARI